MSIQLLTLEQLETRAQTFRDRELVAVLFEFEAISERNRLIDLKAGAPVTSTSNVVKVYELHNTSPDAMRFEVSGIEVQEVLMDVADLIEDTGWELSRKVLWHSHNHSEEPSARDIAYFPKYLFDEGIVYHTPTMASSRYNGTGVLSASSASVSASLVTGCI